MLDEYETVRGQTTKGTKPQKLLDTNTNHNFKRMVESKDKFSKPRETAWRKNVDTSPRESQQNPDKNKNSATKFNPVFEKRREVTCFFCSEKGHIRPNCPKLEKEKRYSTVNNLETFPVTDNLEKYKSKAIINGREQQILRDTGASTDVCASNYVNEEDFTGELIWIRQPLDPHPKCLPVAKIIIEIPEIGSLETRAAIFPASLDQGYYILGNHTAELIETQKRRRSHVINSVVTRSVAKKLAENKLQDELEQNAPVQNSAAILHQSEDCSSESNNQLLPGMENPYEVELIKIKREELVKAQNECPKLEKIRETLGVESTGLEKERFTVERDLIFRVTRDHLGADKNNLLSRKNMLIKFWHCVMKDFLRI